MMLAQKLANKYRKEIWVVASGAVRTLKDLSCLPKMQEAIPTELFMHTANSLAMSQASFAILFCEGVLRRNADTIEIWAPDVAAPEKSCYLRKHVASNDGGSAGNSCCASPWAKAFRTPQCRSLKK